MKLRVGLVGLGSSWESRHRVALHALRDRFEVRAICTPVAHLASVAVKEFRAAPVHGFRALAERDDVDAILLLAADWYGPLPILAACDTGKAVYCGDLMELSPAGTDKLKRRLDESGIAFVAEFPCRHAPATLRLKELIATDLGQPQLMFCHQRRPPQSSGGRSCPASIRDLAEAVDWCRYIAGCEPTSVVGLTHLASIPEDQSDYQMMTLDFSDAQKPGSGTVAQISCGRYIPADWREAVSFRPPAAVQVVCQRGIAFIDLPSTLIWFDSAGRHMESLESERSVGEQLLLGFYRAVTSLVRSTSSLNDAFQAQHIVRQAQASHALGRRIEL